MHTYRNEVWELANQDLKSSLALFISSPLVTLNTLDACLLQAFTKIPLSSQDLMSKNKSVIYNILAYKSTPIILFKLLYQHRNQSII
jgi:hypothetical protein